MLIESFVKPLEEMLLRIGITYELIEKKDVKLFNKLSNKIIIHKI
jgi:hypothetical protein